MEDQNSIEGTFTTIADLLAAIEPGSTLLEAVINMAYRMFGEDFVELVLNIAKIHVHACVLDTNAILNALKYSVTHNSLTALLIAARIGGIRLFASTTVRDEVIEKIDMFATMKRFDPDQARRIWEIHFAPTIVFLDPTELPPLSSRVCTLSQRDLDDVPTGQIIELLRPHIVLSTDKDLVDFEILSWNSGLVASAFQTKSTRDIFSVGIHLGGGVVLSMTMEAIGALIRLLTRLNKKVVLVLVAALGIAFVLPPTRRWLKERLRPLSSFINGGIEWGRDPLQALFDEIARFIDIALESEELISSTQRTVTLPRLVRDHIVVALATAPVPLSVKNITKRMVAQGYTPKGMHPESYVRKILHTYSQLFELRGKRHWSLKSHLK